MNNSDKKQINKTEKQMNKYHWSILTVFVGIVAAITVILAITVSNRSTHTMQAKVSTLIRANTYQQVMNVNRYLDRIEDTASLFFSDEVYYTYDADDAKYDAFEKIQMEAAIQSRIQDLGILENFSDFGIVYTDDSNVGWISDTSYRIYPEGTMYNSFAEMLGDGSDSGWFCSDRSNYDRLYYIKRLNEGAILFTSFYTNELETVFEVPEEIKDMAIRLVDENSIVVYSTEAEETGAELDKEISDILYGQNNSLVLNDSFLVTSNKCSNGKWRVVCSIPKKTIMQEIDNLNAFIYIISIVLSIIVVVFGFIIVSRISNQANELMAALKRRGDLDQLTGLLNKMSYKGVVSSLMQSGEKNHLDVFVMMDMDNFKSVNDTLGHDTGDKVLVRLASIIKRVFPSDFISGRIGGDEFAAYTHFENMSDENARKQVLDTFEIFNEEFAKEFAEEKERCGVSLSVGVAVVSKGEMIFDELYRAADSALYSSKENGKNRLTFYSKE